MTNFDLHHTDDRRVVGRGERHFAGLEAPPTSYPASTVPELITATAQQRASSPAIRFGRQELTYGDVEERSTRLAYVLRARGVRAGTLVALLVDRSPEMVTALLAILKAGGAYVPLDPSYPPARLNAMLSLSGATLVLAEDAVLARLEIQIETDVLRMDTWEAQEGLAFTDRPGLGDAAYVIFTSGSTGKPKGVEISHGALVNLFWSLQTAPGINAEDTVLAVTNISFDMAWPELLLPLVVGARVEMATYQEAADPVRMMAKLEDCGVTLLQATPVTWRLLIEAGWMGTKRLRVWCGGEEMTQTLAGELLSRAEVVWNLYGPTETTVFSTAARITSSKVVPLGAPIANTGLYVLDEERNPVVGGETGELYIGGAGLAKGYWKRADLTDASFPTITLADGTRRLYKTGDRVRILDDGTLFFLGRMDRQVKLRGFRIELGEIEQVASTYPGVQQVVVIKVDDPERGDSLAAYVVPAPGKSPEAAGVKQHIAANLPHYMVPATVRLLERLPVTLNSKVDRSRLPAPMEQEHVALLAKDEPQQEMESRLARMWREALRIPAIGRDENFFALGGDSLLAAQLATKMSKAFHRSCTISSMMQAPTIAAYASFLNGGSVLPYVLLGEGSPEKRNEAIFWIDSPDKLHELAGLLGEYPFYSMMLSAEKITAEAPRYPMERLAGKLVDQILKLQRKGHFYVGGFCQQALLAYEVGHQLRERGYDVPLLIMMDTEPASINETSRPLLETASRRLKRESFHFANMLNRPMKHWLPYLQRRYLGIRFVLDERRWQRIARAGKSPAEPARELSEALFVSRLTYTPARYSGRVLFIEATLRPEWDEQVAMEEWDALVADASRQYVPAEHLGLFAFPAVQTLALAMREALDKTRELVSSSDQAVNS